MAKLTTFVFIPVVVLFVAIFSAVMFRRDHRSAFSAVLSLVACGLCALVSLLMQLATGGTQGFRWWFIVPGFLFALALALFAAKRQSAGTPRLIFVLTFLTAISTGIGIGLVVEADLKAINSQDRFR